MKLTRGNIKGIQEHNISSLYYSFPTPTVLYKSWQIVDDVLVISKSKFSGEFFLIHSNFGSTREKNHKVLIAKKE